MRMKKIFFIFLLVFLISDNAVAAEPLELTLAKSDGKIRIQLLNRSHEPILVNKRFSVGSMPYPTEIELIISDQKGKRFPFACKMKMRSIPENKDFIRLAPGSSVGRDIGFEFRVKGCHGLVPGSYTVKATYKNLHWLDRGAFGGRLESNTITIHVKSDR